MKKYDFDTPVNRRGTNSMKWDTHPDVLPMWVADMDFKTMPEITDALRKRVDEGIFGYTIVPDSYYQAVTGWFARRHQWQMDPKWILTSTGVVPATAAVLRALTLPGEKVLIQTPVYNCFYYSIRNCGCETTENALVRQGDTYVIDFDDFEQRCADPRTTAFLLCSPHNPAGFTANSSCPASGSRPSPAATRTLWTRLSSSTRRRRTSTSRDCRWRTSSARTTTGDGRLTAR